jgi:hypothetical protein
MVSSTKFSPRQNIQFKEHCSVGTKNLCQIFVIVAKTVAHLLRQSDYYD